MSIRKRLRRARHSFYEYISFTEGEFRGTMLLLSIVVFLIGVRWLLPFFDLGKYNNVNAVIIENPDSIKAVARRAIEEHRATNAAAGVSRDDAGLSIPDMEIAPSRFAFDPNTVSFPDLLKLGFDRRVANNIVRYRDKGGKFKSPNDLYKIYGVDERLIDDLLPYVVLPEAQRETARSQPDRNERFERTTPAYTPREATVPTPKERALVEINTADSATLVTVRGIGPVFASRIVKYRDRLGGFVSKEQLQEVFGLTPEHFETIEPGVVIDPGVVQRININTVTFDQLRTHPYMKFNVAKAIVAYREQHGAFKSKEELRRVALVDEAFYQKFEPYFTLE